MKSLAMKWFAEAPSNIALIKYMGRTNEENKIPANPSFSYTLPHLKSYVEIEYVDSPNTVTWEPLNFEDSHPIQLSMKAQERFFKHLAFMFKALGYAHSSLNGFIIRSSNNFPLGVGLASSASSFAALSLAASRVVGANNIRPNIQIAIDKIAQLSRIGSGSSCRSFYAPWVLWDNESVQALDFPHYAHLMHQVVIINAKEKAISSSQAHQYVKTSTFYAERPERAAQRLQTLFQALKNQQWEKIAQITWDEFQDMHQLFETASPSFSYRNEASLILLKKLEKYWEKKGDGPLVTMDAGPNIHLLYRPDQQEIQQEIQKYLLAGYSYVFSP